MAIDLFDKMLDIKPIFCHIPTSHISTETFNRSLLSCPASTFPKSSISYSHYDNITCSVNNQLRSKNVDTVRRQRIKYSDVPKSSGILKKKSKSNEVIFKENSTQSKLMTNKKPVNYIRHIGSQTDYREESTQTDPFSPAYTISGGEHPEVFALSDFTYGKGLPATSLEISFIERLRARREWEQDHTIDITRTKIVIEREIREWQLREKEIKLLQDTRHKLFTKKLHTYIEMDEDVTQHIIDLSIYRQEKQLKFQHKRLEIETSRDIRRIKRFYQLREAKINAVTNYRRNGCVSLLKPPWHTRPHFGYLIDRFKMPQDNSNKKSYRRMRDLDKAYQLIQKEKSKQFLIPEKKPLRFVEKIEIMDHVKQSQIVLTQTEAHNPRRIVIIKLQNYLRSIVVQSKISNVCQIRQDLLDELRSELKHDQISSLEPRTQIYDYLEGATIADMFDFLSKELLRLQCEQTIHLFILLADRHRYQREAAETGDRSQSIEQQNLQEHAFQEMFSLNSNSDIESYLQDLILESISNTADEQARLEIKQIAEILVNQTDQINNCSSNQSNIEMIVSELVHHFLFPTVQRILTQKKHKN